MCLAIKEKSMVKFKVGDKAVYPAHGVGEITSIENREISGKKLAFYILKIADTDMTIMIPTSNVESVGLREIISPKEVDKVLKILRKKKVERDTQTWNRRYREYMKKIKTGSVYEIAEVLRDLSLLKTDKTLSFGEKKMFDTAQNLLKKEIALAKKKPEISIEKVFKRIFKA
jgi:CarD family transcriptional regulator